MNIGHLETLSKLTLTDSERAKCEKEIEEVIEYFNLLSELDTENAEALTHHFELSNILRADSVKESLPAEEITKNAVCEDGFFVTPKAVEG